MQGHLGGAQAIGVTSPQNGRGNRF